MIARLSPRLFPRLFLADYGRSPRWLMEAGAWRITWLVPGGLALLLGVRPGLRRWAPAALLFAAGLLPVLGLVPFGFQDISTVADRYVYLAMLGPALALGQWLDAAPDRRGRPRAAAIGLAILALLSLRQVRVWKNNATLFGHVLAAGRSSSLAHANAGLMEFGQGRLDQAVAHYRAALAISPRDPIATVNLGNALAAMGRVDEAMLCYSNALAIAPDDPKAWNNLGLAFARQGRLADAVAHYSRALAVNPLDYPAHYNLGNALGELGRLEEALAHYRRALEVRPSSAEAHNNAGTLLARAGDLEGALAHFSAALALGPGDPRAHGNLGTALLGLGRLDEAERHYAAALQANPDYADARQGLAAVAARRRAP